MDFATIISTLTDWVVAIGGRVNDLPGTTAFGLGLFTWFAVEQILKRLINGLRWILIIGILGALGLSVPYMLGLMTERGGEPPVLETPEPTG